MGDVKCALLMKIMAGKLTYSDCIIRMGMISLEDYWERYPVFHYSRIADRISHDFFQDISRYLYFVNNNSFFPQGLPEPRPSEQSAATNLSPLSEMFLCI